MKKITFVLILLACIATTRATPESDLLALVTQMIEGRDTSVIEKIFDPKDNDPAKNESNFMFFQLMMVQGVSNIEFTPIPDSIRAELDKPIQRKGKEYSIWPKPYKFLNITLKDAGIKGTLVQARGFMVGDNDGRLWLASYKEIKK